VEVAVVEEQMELHHLIIKEDQVDSMVVEQVDLLTQITVLLILQLGVEVL
tara:strand:+ start:373 stop:522 length:150 start_codon:yes stop_codon:yes gene_type:complete